MNEKVVSIEDEPGPHQLVLRHILRMVPERDKNDVQLHRLLAFRLRIDGEAALREFLLEKVRLAIQCGYTGRFFEFIKDDLRQKECRPPVEDPPPGGEA
jgi:hypothetical protein